MRNRIFTLVSALSLLLCMACSFMAFACSSSYQAGQVAQSIGNEYKTKAMLLAVLPVLWMCRLARIVIRRTRLERRSRNSLCPSCGYDLRASQERCPECGTPTATKNEASA
jgi:hypothetical protein